MTITIFYHTNQPTEARTYWLGEVSKDGSCIRTIKTIRGKGDKALQSAIKKLEKL